MARAEDLLRPGWLPFGSRETGFQAEIAPDGALRRFGFYRQGKPMGWVLDGLTATRLNQRAPGEHDGEWLRDMVETIYREAEVEHVLCAFCHKSRAEVATLIAGPDRYTYICDECVETCAKIIGEANRTSPR